MEQPPLAHTQQLFTHSIYSLNIDQILFKNQFKYLINNKMFLSLKPAVLCVVDDRKKKGIA